MLSFKLEKLKYLNKHKMRPGETIVQEYTFINDGIVEWPEDTYFIFSAYDNPLDLPEEI
jgi:hypothetical protein